MPVGIRVRGVENTQGFGMINARWIVMERTINTFGRFFLRFMALGVATPDPGEAPPMAGYNVRSLFS